MKRIAEDSEETEPTGGTSSALVTEKKRKTDSSAGTRRTTCGQRPSLSIEVIAKVASFANYVNDLMNICVAVGHKDANIVRIVCLRNNLNYLRWILKGRIERNTKFAAYWRERKQIVAWMNINCDWRKYCTKQRVSDPAYCNASTQNEQGKIIYSSDPLVLFNNPAIAIEFGLVSVLKHLVEDVGIDVNAYKWCAYGFPGRKQNPVACAALFSKVHSACFELFLTKSDIDLNARLCKPPKKGIPNPQVWVAAFQSSSVFVFQTMLQHPGFDPNGSDSKLGRPYLGMAASNFQLKASVRDQKLKIGKFQCLLDAGADPELGALEWVRNQLQRHGENSERDKFWKILIRMMEEVVTKRNGGGEN